MAESGKPIYPEIVIPEDVKREVDNYRTALAAVDEMVKEVLTEEELATHKAAAQAQVTKANFQVIHGNILDINRLIMDESADTHNLEQYQTQARRDLVTFRLLEQARVNLLLDYLVSPAELPCMTLNWREVLLWLTDNPRCSFSSTWVSIVASEEGCIFNSTQLDRARARLIIALEDKIAEEDTTAKEPFGDFQFSVDPKQFSRVAKHSQLTEQYHSDDVAVPTIWEVVMKCRQDGIKWEGSVRPFETSPYQTSPCSQFVKAKTNQIMVVVKDVLFHCRVGLIAITSFPGTVEVYQADCATVAKRKLREARAEELAAQEVGGAEGVDDDDQEE